jgi:RNA polymerase sigma factor (sigma-70 family)
MSDEELLRAYAADGSESAFTELVRRHAGAVQAAALRQTGNRELAQEITHAVFLQLARKARSLRSNVVLLGWLLRAARFAAIDALRSNVRRQQREASFLAMQSIEAASSQAETETVWSRIEPLLDEALWRLREKDRHALLLRFFENKTLAAVGAALGIPEDAARKRVHRALERLQAQLRHRGAIAPAAILPGLLSSQAAPASTPEFVQATAKTALMTREPSSITATLAAALGRRLLWAALRPWACGAAVIMIATAGLGVISRTIQRSPVVTRAVDDDYRPAGFPDAEVVRDFVAQLQQELGAGNRQAIAGMIRFPLRVNLPHRSEFIPDGAALANRFDTVFRPEVVVLIRKSPNRGLFCDATGVMVGDGTVWIAPVGNPAQPLPRIVAMNLP